MLDRLSVGKVSTLKPASKHQETLTPEEAGRRLGMSRSTVTQKIASGEIEALKVGSHYRIPLGEFQSYRDRLIGKMIAATSDDIDADLNSD